MEKFAPLLLVALFSASLLRMLLLPIKGILKLLLHSGCGFVCLWLLSSVTPFTGIAFPINAVTVAIAGTLGLPGLGILALLAVLS